MQVSPSKENILKRVRKALSQAVPLPFPQAEGRNSVFTKGEEDLGILFAQSFSALDGRFIFCTSTEELAENLKLLAAHHHWESVYCRELEILHVLAPFSLPFMNASEDIHKADAGLTSCEVLVARTGSIVVSAAQPSGRTVSVFPPVHLVIAYADQLVFDIKNALDRLKTKYGDQLPSMISFQSGPGRTSDVENTSVTGTHGPVEVYVFLLDQQRETI